MPPPGLLPRRQAFERGLDRLRRFLQQGPPLQQLKALVLLALGWLLSPLCWWNDLVINLPVAWLVARLLAVWQPSWFTPGLVLGYWLSNVAGILLLQSSALEVFRDDDTPRDRRRELLVGLATATAYSLLVLGLVKLGLLHTPLPQLEGALPPISAA
ncbi:MAG: hypothetical protein ACKN89_07320 [Cyanobium sp.]|jgi:hypothetical protein